MSLYMYYIIWRNLWKVIQSHIFRIFCGNVLEILSNYSTISLRIASAIHLRIPVRVTSKNPVKIISANIFEIHLVVIFRSFINDFDCYFVKSAGNFSGIFFVNCYWNPLISWSIFEFLFEFLLRY